MKRTFTLLLLLIMPFTLFSCNRRIGFKYVEGKVNIVATTTMIGDLAFEIGKENVSVTTLMQIGVDPHSFVPRPSVTKAIKEADLVLTNGLNLEAKMGKVLQVLDDKLIELGNFLPEEDLIKDEYGEIEPHIWFDVNNWIIISEVLKDKLVELDSGNKEAYLKNYNAYKEKLNQLDEYVINKADTLDKEKRILITAHDAFSYFGRRYDFEVLSIQGISTETEASAKDIKDLATLIVEKKVKAIFLESSIPENTIKSVIDAAKARGHNVVIGGTLYGDSLGNINSGADTYINMVKRNIDIIVESLG